MSKSLLDKFQFSWMKQNLVLLNVMSMSNQIRSKLVPFSVSSPSHPDPFKMTNVWAVDNLKLSKQKIDIQDLKNGYQHLHDLDFTSIYDNDAGIIISHNCICTDISKLERTTNLLTFNVH